MKFLQLTAILVLSSFTIAQNVPQGAFSSLHVQTDDPQEYIDYLKENTEAFEAIGSDMAGVCEIFCDTLKSESISFCLGTERGCSRYHIDNVPMRLLVTYSGQGTEWLPNEIANRIAFEEGLPNEKIVRDYSKIQHIDTWNIAIFRGGSAGLLHRTPDSALKNPSILLRLDHESFWDNILKQQESNLAF